MKNRLAFLVFIITVQFSNAQVIQSSLIPEAVKNNLSEKYPAAKGITWHQSEPGFVEASFSHESINYRALFASTGAWISTENKISAEGMPASALSYLQESLFLSHVKGYFRNETSSKGTQYSAEAKREGLLYEFVFDEQGTVLMRTVNPE